MCGNEVDELQTVKISQAELDVCEDCSEMGSTVEDASEEESESKYSTTSSSSSTSSQTSSSSSTSQSSSSTPSSGTSVAELRIDYGDAIEKAREEKGLTAKELASDLNEKASHIRSIEKEERQPTQELQDKLESKLGISLEESSEYDTEEKDTDSSLTLGDKVELGDK